MTGHSGATRRWVWLQLVVGWLPVWALYTLLVSPVNPIHGQSRGTDAIISGFIAVALAALLGLVVQRVTERVPWPRVMAPGFVGLHLAAAAGYSVAWLALKGVVELLIHESSAVSFHFLLLPNLILGIWLYVMVAGISYANQATERAARAEAVAARSQLAALRGQLNPHFLFNALHTVVQLIPRDPRGAARAAEQVAGLLRTTLEEERDLISLAEELAFVERYLELERTRFGDRLLVTITAPEHPEELTVPSFALQTLVENSVRHGAAPRVEPTEVHIEGSREGPMLRLTVRDTGAGFTAAPGAPGGGTGLARLRERLAVLYGRTASLSVEGVGSGGTVAMLRIPQDGARPQES